MARSEIRAGEQIKALREDYQELKPRYERLASEIARILEQALPVVKPIAKPQAINWRVKDESSLVRKLWDKNLKSLDDVSDLAGVRVIVYFRDHVAAIDKGVLQDCGLTVHRTERKRVPSGYQAVHHEVSLGTTRSGLPESADIAALKAELQVCTVLQHAWAETEHDRGYKSWTPLSPRTRTLFDALAKALDAADDNLVVVRDAADEERADADGPLGPGAATAMARDRDIVRELDRSIAARLDTELRSEYYADWRMDAVLQTAGFRAVGEVLKYVQSNEAAVLGMVGYRGHGVPAHRGVALMNAGYLRMIRDGRDQELAEVMARIFADGQDYKRVVTRIREEVERSEGTA